MIKKDYDGEFASLSDNINDEDVCLGNSKK